MPPSRFSPFLRAVLSGESRHRDRSAQFSVADGIAEMRRLTEEAIRAGAFGSTTSRTNAHKTTSGEMVPGRFAEIDELTGIGRCLGAAGAGTFGMNSDFEDEEAEFAWITRLGKETGRPIVSVDRPADRSAAPAAYHGRRPCRARRRCLGDRHRSLGARSG
jgi:N-acyl-D-aspartate/D-glutamate deacylase